ncbi:MAG: hypothetical protein HY301_15615 [Verrucomicrobia bacterium]|nr:hypothetical protein [Verrucomicrobiota bacterium]
MSLLEISTRRVAPEILDGLAAVDQRAVRSRADLVRVNARLGNPSLLARHLQAAFPRAKPLRLVELGAGDGQFLLAVGALLGPAWKDLEVVLVDRHRSVSPQTRIAMTQLGWTVRIAGADVFEWLRANPLRPTDAVVANLFLHHFQWEELRDLLGLLTAGAGHFAACEPRRWHPALLATRFLWALGCHAVTRHDARVSVRAGFAGRELSRLWPGAQRWEMSECEVNLGLHFFAAHFKR